MYRAIQYQVIHIFPSRRTLCCINHATWKTIRLHAELDTDFFTYFTLQWRNNAYLLVTNEPRGRVQCMSKFHTLMTFHWARTRIAQKCASGGDRITTVHGNHFSHRPRARAVIGQWKIVVTECMFCEWKMNHLVLHVRSFGYVLKWWNNWISKIQNFKSNLSISMLILNYHCM